MCVWQKLIKNLISYCEVSLIVSSFIVRFCRVWRWCQCNGFYSVYVSRYFFTTCLAINKVQCRGEECVVIAQRSLQDIFTFLFSRDYYWVALIFPNITFKFQWEKVVLLVLPKFQIIHCYYCFYHCYYCSYSYCYILP